MNKQAVATGVMGASGAGVLVSGNTYVDIVLLGIELAASIVLGLETAKSGGFRRKKQAKAIAPALVDGRTQQEWYEIIKMMGKDEYIKLSRPALDGLEESKYGWDVERLMGKELLLKLHREWYPEKYKLDCKFCGRDGCKKDCDAYWAGIPTGSRIVAGDGRVVYSQDGVTVYKTKSTRPVRYVEPPKAKKPVVSETEKQKALKAARVSGEEATDLMKLMRKTDRELEALERSIKEYDRKMRNFDNMYFKQKNGGW